MSIKTKSERVFEAFLSLNCLAFEKIAESQTPRPDYLVCASETQIIFELKELAEDKNFAVVNDTAQPGIKSHSRTVGAHVRRAIAGSRKQIKYGADQGIPSVLLIYNNVDLVFQMFGTELTDFVAAMYGEYTISINKRTKVVSELFNGNNSMMQPDQTTEQGQTVKPSKNTSFSAVGHLCDRGGTTTVTLFENLYAKVKLPKDQLPPCFEVPHIEIREDLRLEAEKKEGRV